MMVCRQEEVVAGRRRDKDGRFEIEDGRGRSGGD